MSAGWFEFGVGGQKGNALGAGGGPLGTGGGARGFSKLVSWFWGNRGLVGGLVMVESGVYIPDAAPDDVEMDNGGLFGVGVSYVRVPSNLW